MRADEHEVRRTYEVMLGLRLDHQTLNEDNPGSFSALPYRALCFGNFTSLLLNYLYKYVPVPLRDICSLRI